MTRGRKPKPERQPAPPAATRRAPDPPPELDAVELAEWHRLLAILQQEQLISVDQPLLTAYCVAYGRWWRAHRQVSSTGGEVVKSPSGFPIQNPWLSIANQALKQMTQLGAEFGLSPTSRARLRRAGASSPPAEPNPRFPQA